MGGEQETENKWTKGQRWVSDGEPELGLGIIRDCGDGRVKIHFPAADETRLYATDTAPLRRVKFHPGDRVMTRYGEEITIAAVHEKNGLLTYGAAGLSVSERDLSDSISFSKPEDRLFGGKLDDPTAFELRGEALQWRAEIRKSPVRGLTGARMDLIPHQLHIADEVSNRLRPRVLLADQVGLGKTIEACLILHRLILTGRATRVLVLVPDPLIHQWFVELLRRFQLSFSLFDEDRCAAIDHGDLSVNPFLDSQWVLSSIDFLAEDEHRSDQVLEAGWDVVVVDEAHHLEWSEAAPGESYELVRRLAESTPGLLLLTATPQQLGPEGHFARLKLLDPERYPDLAAYREETNHYEEIADAVEELVAGGQPGNAIMRMASGRPRLEKSLDDFSKGISGARERLINDLLDGFGVGRVMFRNTRERLGGFPTREPDLVPVENKPDWLAGLLDRLGEEKLLVITKTRETAEELLEKLVDATGVKAVLFHEELTLLQRDRNAAYFADEEGARMLICSEIGSEGRNFQFARHLVLFDLPDDVDLLEQRIGRLDRIGQKGNIRIHVPYAPGTDEETRVRWLHEGLDAFRASPTGAAEIQRELQEQLDLALGQTELTESLVTTTREVRARISERLAKGQDRLLERTSHQPERSAKLVEKISAWDDDAAFEDFLMRLFEFSGLQIEELGPSRFFLLPAALKSDAFPALPPEGMTATLDRDRALEREQEAFLTMDHPVVRGALDLMLGSEEGNAAFGIWDSVGEKTILLESFAIVECIAPAKLHVERFLPQTPVRMLVDHLGNDHTGSSEFAIPHLRKGDPSSLTRNPKVKQAIIPRMLGLSRELAEKQCVSIISEATERMHSEMNSEIVRLRDLAEVNDHVRQEDIRELEDLRDALAVAIGSARVRLDAVRLIWKAPVS